MARYVTALAALSLPLLAACGGDDSGSADDSSPTSSAEFDKRDLDSAVKAVQEYSDRYTSGDFEGAYQLVSQPTRDAYSEEEFVKIQEACYQGGGTSIDVEGVRAEGDEATVRLVVAGFKESRKAVFEDGGWKAAPASDTDLSLSADKQVAKCKKENGG